MDSVDDLKKLAGITPPSSSSHIAPGGMNMSLTATEKARMMQEHNIQPGTEAWFKLWFSLPYMTGERPL